MRGLGSGQSRVRVAKVRAAKGWGGKRRGGEGWDGNLACGQGPGGLRLGYLARWPESQECQAPESFVLRTCIVGRMEEGEEVTY